VHKLILLLLVLPLASCATSEKVAQHKAAVLASAQSFCSSSNTDASSSNNLLCVGREVYRRDDAIVQRAEDGSLYLRDTQGSVADSGPVTTSMPNAY
jgi:hypothetical protein